MEERNTGQNQQAHSLKEVILSTQEYLRYFWEKKWWIILISTFGAIFGFFTATSTKDTYKAELTFMVNEEEGSGVNGVGSVLGQFGLGFSGSDYNLDKITAIGKSRKIIYDLMLDSVEIDRVGDFLGNHVLDIYGAEIFVGQSNDLQGNRLIDKAVRQNAQLLRVLYSYIVGDRAAGRNGLVSVGYREDTGILKIESESRNEELTWSLANLLYDRMSKFYIDKSTEKQWNTYATVVSNADSLMNLLKDKEYQLARAQDRNLGINQAEGIIRIGRLTRETEILNIVYAETLKNLETSKFILQNSTPYFQVIDNPYLPLEKQSVSKLKLGLVGMFLGTVFGFISFAFIRFYNVMMSS